jgi:hypothetical protein
MATCCCGDPISWNDQGWHAQCGPELGQGCSFPLRGAWVQLCSSLLVGGSTGCIWMHYSRRLCSLVPLGFDGFATEPTTLYLLFSAGDQQTTVGQELCSNIFGIISHYNHGKPLYHEIISNCLSIIIMIWGWCFTLFQMGFFNHQTGKPFPVIRWLEKALETLKPLLVDD